MSFSLVYLAGRFFFRLGDFFHHWYADGSRRFFHWFLSTLEHFDQTFAVRITLEHFFEPLYKDYSPIGRLLGLVFRAGRVLMGSAIYLLMSALFLLLYALWLSLPPFLLLNVFTNL